MSQAWNMSDLTELRDKDIYSSDGEKIGSVKDIFYDDSSGDPEWVGVGTGFLGLKERVVPVAELMPSGDRLVVPFTKDKIEHEPDFDTKDERILDDDETKLCIYFGMTGHASHQTRVLRYGQEYRGTNF